LFRRVESKIFGHPGKSTAAMTGFL